MARFSRTLSPSNTSRFSGTCTTPERTIRCGGRPTSDSPRSKTSPESGRSSPEITRSVVVLPAPLAPISATTSPSGTSIEMPCRIRRPP